MRGKVGRPSTSRGDGDRNESTKNRVQLLQERIETMEADDGEVEKQMDINLLEKASISSPSKPKLKEINRDLRTMIANEEQKKVHLQNIIGKLKAQKTEHSAVIEQLIEENDKLSREVVDGNREVRKALLKEEVSEGRLQAVSCLKGSLMEEMDDQNSLILERGGELAGLNIEMEELRARCDHLEKLNR